MGGLCRGRRRTVSFDTQAVMYVGKQLESASPPDFRTAVLLCRPTEGYQLTDATVSQV